MGAVVGAAVPLLVPLLLGLSGCTKAVSCCVHLLALACQALGKTTAHLELLQGCLLNDRLRERTTRVHIAVLRINKMTS